jgi:hypothetical protein
MSPYQKLLAIKVVHKLIWMFFVAVILYVVYSRISNNITAFSWIGIGLIVGDGVVLGLFNM